MYPKKRIIRMNELCEFSFQKLRPNEFDKPKFFLGTS